MNRSAMTGVRLTCKPGAEVSRVYSPAGSQQMTGMWCKGRAALSRSTLTGTQTERVRVAGGSATVACGLQAGLVALAVVFRELKISSLVGRVLA